MTRPLQRRRLLVCVCRELAEDLVWETRWALRETNMQFSDWTSMASI